MLFSFGIDTFLTRASVPNSIEFDTSTRSGSSIAVSREDAPSSIVIPSTLIAVTLGKMNSPSNELWICSCPYSVVHPLLSKV